MRSEIWELKPSDVGSGKTAEDLVQPGARLAGLDAKKVVDVISKGAAQSWQMENRGYTMIDDKFDYGFAVDWMRKDLGICIDEAKNNGAPIPVTKTVATYYDKIAEKGGNRWDTSSLIRLLKD